MNASRKRAAQDRDFMGMEVYLQSQLGRVAPRPDFVASLRTRLAYVEKPVKKTTAEALRILVLTVAGLLSGAMLIMAAVRATIAILVALGLARGWNQERVQKPIPSS